MIISPSNLQKLLLASIIMITPYIILASAFHTPPGAKPRKFIPTRSLSTANSSSSDYAESELSMHASCYMRSFSVSLPPLDETLNLSIPSYALECKKYYPRMSIREEQSLKKATLKIFCEHISHTDGSFWIATSRISKDSAHQIEGEFKNLWNDQIMVFYRSFAALSHAEQQRKFDKRLEKLHKMASFICSKIVHIEKPAPSLIHKLTFIRLIRAVIKDYLRSAPFPYTCHEQSILLWVAMNYVLMN